MARKILKTISVIEILLSIALFFCIGYVFSNDDIIVELVERTDLVSTLIRLSIFVIPGLHLLTGLFGLVFSARRILVFIGIFGLVSSICLLLFLTGETQFMFYLGIAVIVISILYLITSLFIKKPKQEEIQ